mmetsp:Transcript_9200/g.30664  ORF Transcript_9200/g.30664 Transcript_9200/m.30664 type:complete len:84 (+) Transcript_9200:383-634(+)
MTNVPSETWSLVEQSKESVKFLPATTGSGETFTLLTDRLVAPPPQSDQELTNPNKIHLSMKKIKHHQHVTSGQPRSSWITCHV